MRSGAKPMRYFALHIGGPFDGNREELPGRRFGTIVLKQHMECGLENLAVYKYEKTNESPGEAERIYRFEKTLPFDEARKRLYDDDFQTL